MKLAISNIAWNKDEDLKVYGLMKQYGFNGLEIAPTRIIEESPYDHLSHAKAIAQCLKNSYDFNICSMQSILFGRAERLFGRSSEREVLKQYLKKAIAFALEIGCRNMVFGSPKNRIIENNGEYNIAVEFFKEIGDYAFENNTVLSIEANPRIYGTNFINSTDEAVQLVKDVGSKGFKINLDYGTIIENNESLYKLCKIVDIINHVHISEPNLVSIIERKDHIELAKILKDAMYQGYISVEMKRAEEDNINNIKEKLQYVSKVFGG